MKNFIGREPLCTQLILEEKFRRKRVGYAQKEVEEDKAQVEGKNNKAVNVKGNERSIVEGRFLWFVT